MLFAFPAMQATFGALLILLSLLYGNAVAASEPFDEWLRLATAQPSSPVTAEQGDQTERWTAPDGQAVILVVRAPRPVTDLIIYAPSLRDGADATPYFEALVARAVTQQASRLVLPPGFYHFRSLVRGKHREDSHVLLKGLHDITIDGSGAVFIFDNDKHGIVITQSQRLKLTNLTIRYGFPTMSLMQAERGPAGEVVLRLADPRYDHVANMKVPYVTEFDLNRQRWVNAGQRVILSPGSKDTASCDETSCRSPAFGKLQPGRTYVAFHSWYGGIAIYVDDSPVSGTRQAEDISIDNVTIQNGPGMGIVAYGLKRGFAVTHSRIAPADDISIGSVAYDAINTPIGGGDMLIADNVIEGQGDDGINFNNPVHPIVQRTGDNQLVLSAYSRFIRKDDRLAMFAEDGRYLGTSSVVTQPTALGGLNYAVTVNSLPEGSPAFVRDVDLLTRRAAVLRNRIGRCHCHGILIQIPFVRVAENTFKDLPYNSIRLLANFGTFKEGSGAFNVSIEKNMIENNGADASLPFKFGAISAYGVRRDGKITAAPVNAWIDISNNTITSADQACISVASSFRVRILNNSCLNTNSHGATTGGGINVLNARFVELSGNRRDGSTAEIFVDTATTSDVTKQDDF